MDADDVSSYQPDQLLLLSPDLREWLPPGHLAHHVGDLVDALELGAFYAPYEGDGRRNAPYEPSMMVKVLIYAYATGVFSSRAIARKLEEDVAFRVLAAGNFPQHRTICEFRRRHLGDFERMFVEVVRLAREMGVVRFGTLSVDGTKVRANASKRKWLSEGPNGWIKEVLGFRRFSLRGLDKVRGEWHLVCLALNVRRLAAMAA